MNRLSGDQIIKPLFSESQEFVGELSLTAPGAVGISLDGCVLDCPVHPLDPSVGPRVIGLGQPMFDPVFTTGAIERVAAEHGGRTGSVLWQIGELDAIVGKHDLDSSRARRRQGPPRRRARRAYWPCLRAERLRTLRCGRLRRRDRVCLAPSALRRCRRGRSRSDRS